MKTQAGTLAAPFPYFGGKSGACETVWPLFGEDVANYVEPFFGSGAMLLGRPTEPGIETVNDFDGFVANFWRAIAADPEAVAHYADWPCNEIDLFARHAWLVQQTKGLVQRLESPDYYDAKIAGWWCWGACNWIGHGWCGGEGPWQWDEETQRIINIRKLPHLSAGQGINRNLPHLGNAGRGINRKLPHLSAGRGINRKLPHLGNAGQGINRKLPHLGNAGQGSRYEFIVDWFNALHDRMRDVRVTCGDWTRVLKDSATTRHGLTAVFLDPPYDKGAMDYGAGGMRQGISAKVREWCVANGKNPLLRIVLCGHAGEHDDLMIEHGWQVVKWEARKGYALTEEAVANSQSETVWASPHCLTCKKSEQAPLF